MKNLTSLNWSAVKSELFAHLLEQKRYYQQAVLFVSVAILSFAVGYRYPKAAVLVLPKERVVIQETTKDDDFTEAKLVAYLKELHVKYPKIVVAQAKLESNNFTSQIFKENHNLFGMKPAEIRSTTSKGWNREHAMYKNWRASVDDYAMYQCMFISKIKSEDEYKEYLQKNYSQTSTYMKRVERILNGKI